MPSQDSEDQLQDWEVIEAPADSTWPARFSDDHRRIMEHTELWFETPAGSAFPHDVDSAQDMLIGANDDDVDSADDEDIRQLSLVQLCGSILVTQRLREHIHENILKHARSQDDETTTAVRAYRIEEDLRLVREEFERFHLALRAIMGSDRAMLDFEFFWLNKLSKLRWRGLKRLQGFEADDHCYFNGLTQQERAWSLEIRQALARMA